MAEGQIEKLVESSPMVINGYAFNRLDDNIRALNLNTGDAVVMHDDGTVVETSMDDIEIEIVRDYYERNSKFMGEEYA